ncbi:ribose 5-phosphate isomerase A [Staphylococcus sp. SQ8-PEA]|uniref:Ribose-5-phosphate isomerase A n=1 Tax=Staphylococcus marylandisciuri TaxID=2981529 RepID=A0ABT2QMN4_9STAP|nr:ribose 5-phosphate isomerase A [Staphylococcus marylandisciuri]MCU5745237.1 ribose 5-phosphate isomerase A [Staphylococcus marylandisciuri]
MMDIKQLKMSTFDDALNHITDNIVLGIGSGSTIELLVPKIAEKVRAEKLNIIGVCTSTKTAFIAKEHGLKIVDINDVDHVDIAIDGADEVDSNLNLIKGGGGALFREKVIDTMAEKFIVIVDETKEVAHLGDKFKLPVEVDKFNWLLLARKIEQDQPVIAMRRMADDVPFITDNGNYILDLELKERLDPYQLHEYLIHLIGVLETGYFLDTTEAVIFGTQDGVKIKQRS